MKWKVKLESETPPPPHVIKKYKIEAQLTCQNEGEASWNPEKPMNVIKEEKSVRSK